MPDVILGVLIRSNRLVRRTAEWMFPRFEKPRFEKPRFAKPRFAKPRFAKATQHLTSHTDPHTAEMSRLLIAD